MSDLVGNPEDRFSRVEAHIEHFLFTVTPTITTTQINTTMITSFQTSLNTGLIVGLAVGGGALVTLLAAGAYMLGHYGWPCSNKMGLGGR